MLTTTIKNPIPLITNEEDLKDWEEFPEGFEEEEDEEDDSEQPCTGDDSITE